MSGEPPEIWSFEPLWQKARLYVQRALDEDRNGPLFAFWATLALELVGRAAVANVHPVLLADPQDGKNILFAVGYQPTGLQSPRSVPAKTVFHRCTVVVAEFTTEDFDRTMALVDRRNAELHTGRPAFEDYPSRLWLTDYFRICGVLVSSFGMTLTDLFGEVEANAAIRMIEAAQEELRHDMEELIAERRREFAGLDEEARDSVIARAETLRIDSELQSRIECPSCGAPAILVGEQIGAEEPHLEGDEIVVLRTVLPTSLSCPACGLTLTGYEQLHAVSLGGQFSTEAHWDPAEYYGPEIADRRAELEWDWDDDYMNE